MNLSHAIILFLAALLAGAINAVAGGGSFVSFPTLMFIGVPAKFANATNTVALWPGQVASIGAYRRQFAKLSWRMMAPLLVTCVIGGIGGAWVLLKTPTTTFVWLVPWLILSATIIFMMSGRVTRWVRGRTASNEHHQFSTGRAVVFQLVIAFYIGYFGAGAGILILAMLALLGMDEIHSMNALKALLTTISNGVAMLMFVFSNAVYWPEAILMIVASIARRLLRRALCTEDETGARAIDGDRDWFRSDRLLLRETIASLSGRLGGFSPASGEVRAKAELHDQQGKRQQERNRVGENQRERVNQKAIGHPQQQADIQAHQHGERNIANGFGAKRMQGLGKIRQRAKGPRSKTDERYEVHVPA